MSCVLILKKDQDDAIKLLLYRNARVRGEEFCWGAAVSNFEDENEKSVAFSKTSLKDDRYAVLRRAAVRECIKSVGGGRLHGSSSSVRHKLNPVSSPIISQGNRVVLRGIPRLNIKDSVLTNVCVPPGLVEAASDPNLTTAMTIEYVIHGQAKKISLYLYFMDEVKDAGFVNSWTPRSTNEYSHIIDESYRKSTFGFVWANLQQVCQTPSHPTPTSTQPLAPILLDIFAHHGEEIMTRVAHLASSKMSNSVPIPAPMASNPPSRAVHAPNHSSLPQAYAVSIPTNHHDSGAYQSGSRFTDPVTNIVVTRSPPSTEVAILRSGRNTHDSTMAHVTNMDTTVSRGNGGYPANTSLSTGTNYTDGNFSTVAVSSPRGTSQQMNPIQGSSSQYVLSQQKQQQQQQHVRADDDSRSISSISGDNDYSGYTLTQLETHILSPDVSDESVISMLMRSELHTRVLKSTMRGGQSDEDMKRLYTKLLVSGGRAKFVTFLRVQCHIFNAMHNLS